MSDLWAVHIEPVDDLLAAADLAAAWGEVRRINEGWHGWHYAQPGDPVMVASVVPWPHSAEAHARSLHTHGGRYEP